MTDFILWFTTGFRHILDWNAYDHLCYIIALSIVFTPKEWKKLLLLITAFTIGHSLTLALCTSNLIHPPQKTIELLIPITIIITCLVTISKRNFPAKTLFINYLLALFFGFIHGMGFSYLLKSMLGREQNIIGPLFSFNIGLEFGQLLIVFITLVFSVFLERVVKIKKTNYVFFISLAICIIASILLIERVYDKN